MYFALTFRILLGITSLLFIKFTYLPVLNTAFELIKPLFNAILIIGAYKLAKYCYFLSKDNEHAAFYNIYTLKQECLFDYRKPFS